MMSKLTTVRHTHQVFNQAQPFVNINLLKSDPALLRALKSFGCDSFLSTLNEFGVKSGSAELMDKAQLAEKNRPVLRQFDNYGRRIDRAEYHGAYHDLMAHGISNGAASFGYNNSSSPGSHTARAALIYMENQLEPGHCCPIVMTAAAAPVFQRNREATGPWFEKTCRQVYDPRDVPIQEKEGVTIGMSMTEKQGGSDVRANTTIAVPEDPSRSGPGAVHLITGHKWFTSAPMCDGFLTLAKVGSADKAPTCFLVPRWLPDGSRNLGFKVMRLKDKLADRSNGSSEVEYDNAWSIMVGEEGRGVKTIIEMVQSTRLDCALGSAGGARRALQLALNHTATRAAFGSPLIQQPLMQMVLAELCAEAEAHTLTSMRMASAFDAASRGDEAEAALFRIGVAVSKYFITKRLPHFTYECMESMGGNGFVEDFPMAMLFRHSPLNAIWEGSGNVIALDVFRAAGAIPHLLKEIARCKGMDSSMDAFMVQLQSTVSTVAASKDLLSPDNQRKARHIVDSLAVGLQASVLLRYGSSKAATVYIARHVAGDSGFKGVHYGSLGISAADAADIIADNMPVFA